MIVCPAMPLESDLYAPVKALLEGQGYVVKGSFKVTYLDGPEEVVGAGEIYHLRPGHFVQTLEPVELVELSPAHEHDKTMAVIQANLSAGALS